MICRALLNRSSQDVTPVLPSGQCANYKGYCPSKYGVTLPFLLCNSSGSMVAKNVSKAIPCFKMNLRKALFILTALKCAPQAHFFLLGVAFASVVSAVLALLPV